MAVNWVFAISTVLLFVIITSPPLYKLTNTIFAPIGVKTSDSTGRPSNIGIAIHGVVFTALLFLVQKFTR